MQIARIISIRSSTPFQGLFTIIYEQEDRCSKNVKIVSYETLTLSHKLQKKRTLSVSRFFLYKHLIYIALLAYILFSAVTSFNSAMTTFGREGPTIVEI